jgi:DNA-binding response OmpR family regulator
MDANRAGKLLLVEDEHVLRTLIAQFLRVENFEVIEAADGQEALERYAAFQPFDVVLLDLNLPIFCGVDVCRRIKIERPDQQVLICSAAVMDSDIDVLHSLGVERFLTKPYHPLDLLTGIDLAMGRCNQAFSSRAGRYFGTPHSSIRRIDSVRPATQTLVK